MGAMNSHYADWRPVVRFGLRGGRFDGTLTISDLAELETYQELITETAAALWRRANVNRQRLPKGFELGTQLRFSHVEVGSSVVPLEARVRLPAQSALFDEDDDRDAVFKVVTGAVEVIWRSVAAASRRERLPEDLPREVLPRLGTLGATLGPADSVEMLPVALRPPATREVAILDRTARDAIASQAVGRYVDSIRVDGRVTAADVTRGRFTVHLDDGREIPAPFSNEQERTVTTALRDHDSIVVAVVGRALFEADGRPNRVLEVESVHVSSSEESSEDTRRLWSALASFGRERSVEGLPSDLGSNLDRYLYDRDS
jgi:hypothetical protein